MSAVCCATLFVVLDGIDLSKVLEALPQGIAVLNSSGQIVYANQSLYRLLKKTDLADLSGVEFAALFPEEARGEIRGLFSEFLKCITSGKETIWNFDGLRVQMRFLPAQGAAAILVLEEISKQLVEITELQQQNKRLIQSRIDLEEKLDSLQIIERLSAEFEYPYGYQEIVKAIIHLLPEIIQLDAAATLIENEEGYLFHIHLQRDIGQENVTFIKEHILELYGSLTDVWLNQNKLLLHFSGSSLSESTQKKIGSYFALPLKVDNRVTGIIGCFSLHPDGFTRLDQQILDIFVNLTSNSIVRLRTLLDSERKRIQAMVESMVDGVLMTDQNDEIVVINRAAKKMLHVSRKEDTITKKYLQENLGFYPFRLTKGFAQKPGSPATIKEEIKIYDKTLHSIVAPVHDTEGNRTGTVVVLRDITEEKEREKRKNDFFSVISHELRTPLASIGGSLDLVLKNVVGQLSEKQRRYIDLAKDSCQKLNVVIDDLLDLSKFEKGKMEIHLDLISVQQLVEEVTEKFQPSAMEKEIILEVNIPAENVRIYADYDRLVQVMNNLLSNAIKFTPVGGRIVVEVFLPKIMPPHIGISVTDTGAGIQPDDLERVFDKFEQVRQSDSRKIGGTGLGLAISRSIIEAHKGKIWAESKAGQGAKFIFILPIEKRVGAAVEAFAEVTESPLEEELIAIIVAADSSSAYVLKGILLERRFKVTVTENEQEGFALIHKEHPDLIILDFPTDYPTQLIEILSHDPDTASIPIIKLSAGQQQLVPFPNVIELQKPVEVEQFRQALDQAILKWRGMEDRKKVLIVDDDESLRMICKEALQYQNYVVEEAEDGSRALEQLKHFRPDVILLDIMLPGIDGLKLAQIIKTNILTSHIPIIFLTARDQTEDKVRALKSGGSDYLVKPFDSTELGARIESILQRREQELASSPTTKLPGSVSIEKEINRRISNGETFALCYLDLDNLKSYNDVYGYAKADGVVKQTGDLIREAVLKYGRESDFIGHVAGDDFVFISMPDSVDNICTDVITKFDQIIPFFYKQSDQDRGYIEAEDRHGVWRKFPIMSVSIVCLTNEEMKLIDHVQIATLAAEYKRLAKAIPGSVYIRNGKTISGRGLKFYES